MCTIASALVLNCIVCESFARRQHVFHITAKHRLASIGI